VDSRKEKIQRRTKNSARKDGTRRAGGAVVLMFVL
jgi:hypothetical protein